MQVCKNVYIVIKSLEILPIRALPRLFQWLCDEIMYNTYKMYAGSGHLVDINCLCNLLGKFDQKR